MKTIYKIKTIGEIHDMLGKKEVSHPLMTILDVEEIAVFDQPWHIKYETDFYTIALKVGGECEIKYGRKSYDFTEGSLVFTKPGQVSEIKSQGTGEKPKGWILCFHEDLIRGTELAAKMGRYTYFDYSNNEALHLSIKEKKTINAIIDIIEDELTMNLDVYSNNLILSNLETLLNYCERFYGRQFITRRAVIQDNIIVFEQILAELADIAYILGYSYPEHFSKFFKKKVGMSPNKYRQTQPS